MALVALELAQQSPLLWFMVTMRIKQQQSYQIQNIRTLNVVITKATAEGGEIRLMGKQRLKMHPSDPICLRGKGDT